LLLAKTIATTKATVNKTELILPMYFMTPLPKLD